MLELVILEVASSDTAVQADPESFNTLQLEWKLMLHNRKLLGQSEACRSSEVLEVAWFIYIYSI